MKRIMWVRMFRKSPRLKRENTVVWNLRGGCGSGISKSIFKQRILPLNKQILQIDTIVKLTATTDGSLLWKVRKVCFKCLMEDNWTDIFDETQYKWNSLQIFK